MSRTGLKQYHLSVFLKSGAANRTVVRYVHKPQSLQFLHMFELRHWAAIWMWGRFTKYWPPDTVKPTELGDNSGENTGFAIKNMSYRLPSLQQWRKCFILAVYRKISLLISLFHLRPIILGSQSTTSSAVVSDNTAGSQLCCYCASQMLRDSIQSAYWRALWT